METKTVLKLCDYFAYTPIKNYNGLTGTQIIASPETEVGIEIELEHVEITTVPATWKSEVDNSLKEDGVEFVSIPLKMKYLEVELNRLYDGIEKCKSTARCSVHVHVNVRDFTLEDLHKFLILYMIFEKSLFRISGNRWKSNYCTPLFFNPDIVQEFMKKPFSKWYKYSALNLAPIYGDNKEGSSKYGTVEFRHHCGCENPEDVLVWCNVVTCLKQAVDKFKLEELLDHLKVMNTSSAYFWLANEVFGNWATLITNAPTFKEDVESCITLTKFTMFKDSTTGTPKARYFVEPKEGTITKPKYATFKTVVNPDEWFAQANVQINPMTDADIQAIIDEQPDAAPQWVTDDEEEDF